MAKTNVDKAKESLKDLGYSDDKIKKIIEGAKSKDTISRTQGAVLVHGKLTILFFLTLINMALGFCVIFVPAIFLGIIPNLIIGVLSLVIICINGFIFARTKKERDSLSEKYDIKGAVFG